MNHLSISSSRLPRELPPFKLSPIHVVVLGVALLSSAPAFASEEDLQAEIARLKQALQQTQQELAEEKAQKAAATPATPATEAGVAGQTGDIAAAEPNVLEEFIIKARKKSVLEKVKDTPKSVSIVGGDELEKQGALNVTDIFKRIGNVQWNYGNPKTGSMAIRGVSAGSSEAIDPSLGVTVDGVPYGYVALASGADYVDIDTVDVTRGPQGSVGGKNTSMGTINITTRRPTFNPEANASITFGQNNSLITQAAAGGAVVDDLLAWRGTFYRNQQEGYYYNNYLDIEDRTSYVNTDRTYGRAQFLLTPTENFNARVSVDYKPKGIEFVNGLSIKNTTPATYQNGKPYDYVNKVDPLVKLSRTYFTNRGYGYNNYINDPINEDQNKGILNGSKGASAELNWNVFGGYNLKSITAYKDNFFQASNDEGTPFDITKNAGLYVHYKQASQELRLTSPADPKRFVDYTAGLLYFTNESDASSRTRYGSDAGAWFATNAQYYGVNSSDTTIVPAAVAGGLIFDASGQLLLRDSLDRVFTRTVTFTDNKNLAAYGQADWHLNDNWTLTTGLRVTKENRRTAQVKETTDPGVAAALNPVAQGGFNSNATTGVLGANTPAQLAQANLVAQRYFGVNYADLDTLPGGVPAGTAARKQIANAKALRASQGYSGLYGYTQAEPFEDILKTGNVSLSYKFNDDLTTYVSWQRGAKAGISQISGQKTAPSLTSLGTGKSALADQESSDAYEFGIRSAFLNKTLVINADIFLDNLRNYQQSVSIFDQAAANKDPANPFITVVGNAKQVQVKGIELDASYSGIPNTTLRFAGAYNDVRYASHTFLANPVEDANLPIKTFDADGKTLPNSSKFTGNLSLEYRKPVFANQEFHTTLNYNYKSSYNSDSLLSDYAKIDGYGITDFGIGIGRKDKLFDANILVKNLFDTDYRNNQTWNSYVPTTNPRWIGIVFSSKL